MLGGRTQTIRPGCDWSNNDGPIPGRGVSIGSQTGTQVREPFKKMVLLLAVGPSLPLPGKSEDTGSFLSATAMGQMLGGEKLRVPSASFGGFTICRKT